jgi:predicted porin
MRISLTLGISSATIPTALLGLVPAGMAQTINVPAPEAPAANIAQTAKPAPLSAAAIAQKSTAAAQQASPEPMVTPEFSRPLASTIAIAPKVTEINQPAAVPPVTPSTQPIGEPSQKDLFEGFDSQKAKDLGGGVSVSVEQQYTGWRNDRDNSQINNTYGSQHITPMQLNYQKNGVDLGLRTAYIRSDFHTDDDSTTPTIDERTNPATSGSVSTFSDTAVTLGYTTPDPKTPIRFSVDVNVPTGQSALQSTGEYGNQNLTLLNSALVQQPRFGEGWNVAPGVTISHAISAKDTVSLGVKHGMKGAFDRTKQFDPITGDRLNTQDDVNPGNETTVNLQYQHRSSNFQAGAGVGYSHFGKTQLQDPLDTGIFKDAYRDGDRWDLNTHAAFKMSPNQVLKLAGRYAIQGDTETLDNSGIVKNNNGTGVFLGADWGIRLNQKHRVHLLGDYLNVAAEKTDRITNQTNYGQNRWTVGIGYDYAFTPDTSLALQAKYFHLNSKSDPTPPTNDTRTNGINLYAGLNLRF